MTQLKVACLGAGYFAQFHHDAWRRNLRCELVAVADRDANVGADFLGLEALLGVHAPDVIDIITPPETHLDAITMALAAKPKAVICQKPFCVDLNQAKVAAKLAQQAAVPLIVHENFRFQPWYRLMKAQLASGALGEVYQMTFRLRPGDGQGPQAYLARQPYFQKMPKFLVHETAVHFIDVFRFMFGMPISVYADLRRLNPSIAGEDAGVVIFEFREGVRAVFDGNRLCDHPAENLRLTLGEGLLEGSKGSLVLDGDGSVALRQRGKVEGQTLLAPKAWQGFGGDCVFALQDHVVAALLDGRSLENQVADYLHVLKIEDAIYKSARTGRKIMLE